MPATRPRRIIKRAVMALAVVVALPVWYVGSVMCLGFAIGAGWVSTSPPAIVIAALMPIDWYLRSRYPGSELIQAGCDWSHEQGQHYRFRGDQ
ncbi:MAG: hypothetical protein U0992_04665 [Planctomycetaceae bacterium]